MVTKTQLRKTKAKSGFKRQILPLLTSASEQKVFAAVSSLKNKGMRGIPKYAQLAEEIKSLGHESPDPTRISRVMDELEKKGYILRDLIVLAQPGVQV
jgi:hypothetical protein